MITINVNDKPEMLPDRIIWRVMDEHQRSIFLKWRTISHYPISIDMQAAELGGANLAGVNLSGANLHGAILRHADLRYANLSNADLSLADLYGAVLNYANLQNVNLIGANLNSATLIGVNLKESNLSDATLISADLSGADLWHAQLNYADLKNAALYNADLNQSTLANARNLETADKRATCLDSYMHELAREFARECPPVGKHGGRIVYRTVASQHVGHNIYEIGHTYIAPVMSYSIETSCHPGIYAASLNWMRSNYGNITFARCYVRDGDWIITDKGAIRCSRLRVLNYVTIDDYMPLVERQELEASLI